jgi:hypothetical protein
VTLANLIRKRDTVSLATAIPAISAISAAQPKGKAATVARIVTVAVANPQNPKSASPATVARIAGIAVANPQEEKSAPPAKVGAGDTVTAFRWLIHYPDRDPVEVACWPDATGADILEQHPDAVAAEPLAPTIRQPSAPLTLEEETAIRAWLALIEETDPVIISEVMGKCQRDAGARDYFTGRAAAELPKPDDDRRTCDQCSNLIARRCQAAKRGEIVASQKYEPIRDLPRRCVAYAPNADDPDRRTGRERWPGLDEGCGGDGHPSPRF